MRLLLLVLFASLSACSVNMQEFADTKPRLDIFEYFNGETYASGVFVGRNGELKRQFTVDIHGVIAGNKLTLTEDFDYADGEKSQRVWVIEELEPGHYSGTAADVVGEARGEAVGSVLNWHYQLELPYKDSTITVNFDDWMYLQPQQILINRATVSKWGFRVGEVLLSFHKTAKKTSS